MILNIQLFGGRGASSSGITKGNYLYTRNGANLSVKVLDVSKKGVLIETSGTLANGQIMEGKRTAGFNSPIIKNMVKQSNKKYTVEYFKSRGTEIRNSVPKGYVKLEGATTAPKGYTWYSNNKSLFGGERRTILVKNR